MVIDTQPKKMLYYNLHEDLKISIKSILRIYDVNKRIINWFQCS